MIFPAKWTKGAFIASLLILIIVNGVQFAQIIWRPVQITGKGEGHILDYFKTNKIASFEYTYWDPAHWDPLFFSKYYMAEKTILNHGDELFDSRMQLIPPLPNIVKEPLPENIRLKDITELVYRAKEKYYVDKIYLVPYGAVFIFDGYARSGKVHVFFIDNQYIFMPEQHLRSLPKGGFREKLFSLKESIAWLAADQLSMDAIKRYFNFSDSHQRLLQILLIALYWFAGFLLLFSVYQKFRPLFLAVCAFPAGVAMLSIWLLILFLAGIPVIKETVMLSLIGLFSIIAAWGLKKKLVAYAWDHLKTIGLFFFLFLICSIFFVHHTYTFYAGDAWEYFGSGVRLASIKYFDVSSVNNILFARGTMMLPLIYCLSRLFSIDLFTAFLPVFFFNFLFLLFYIVSAKLRTSDPERKTTSFFIPGLSVMAFAGTFFIWWASLWAGPHLVATVYFFLTIFFLSECIETNNDALLPIIALFICALAFSRKENLLFILLPLFLYLPHAKARSLWRLYLPVLAICMSWQLLLLKLASTGLPDPYALRFFGFMWANDFLFVQYAMYVIFIAIVFLVIRAYPEQSRKKSSNIFHWLTLLVLFAGYLLLPVRQGILKGDFDQSVIHTLKQGFQHLKIFLQNLLISSCDYGWEYTWGLLWYVLILLGILSFFLKKRTNDSFFIVTILGYILFLVISFSMQLTFRLGCFNGLNRSMVHIVPIILYYLTFKFNATNGTVSNNPSSACFNSPPKTKR